jgi:Diiron non-heme beta-hydroxylase N-terminal domain
MDDPARFLRPDAIIEPLVDGFYAWMHTVTPVQAAMNLAFVQLPLLESYLQSPLVHINASRNPELRGGFFVGIEESRSGEVRDLVASIKRDRTAMLEFAAAVAEAEELVRTSATGFDLTPLYPKLHTLYRAVGVREQRLHRGAAVGSAVAGNRGRAAFHPEHTAAEFTGRPRPANTVPASRTGGAVPVEGAWYDAEPAA